jgi:hypothetical protein
MTRGLSLWLAAALFGTPLAAQQKVQLLFTGNFLAERTWPKTGESWLALYRTTPGFRLVPTRIKVDRVADACADSATKVSADTNATPYLLIKGNALRAGPVDTAFAGNQFLYPGQSISVKFGQPEHWYSMLALGSAYTRPGDIFFSDYRLELHDSQLPGARYVFLKFEQISLENTPNLQWAGDLDRDKRLDLLFQVPIGGYSKQYVLLLSSAASRSELVEQVATFDVLDC